MQQQGKIYVGRCTFNRKTKEVIYPEVNGCIPIIVMHYDNSKWYALSPYVLKDANGRFMENLWQFTKCYKTIPKTKVKHSKVLQWDHDEETHMDENDNVNDAYLAWREKGMNCKYPLRYPVGYEHRNQCKYALAENENGTINYEKLDYIQGRKKIYVPIYIDLVRKEPLFHKLKKKLSEGKNLLIIEVDGPHSESLEYYKNKYGVNDFFIEENTMFVNDENINIMLNDEKHPFGHGYCLAMALFDMKY